MGKTQVNLNTFEIDEILFSLNERMVELKKTDSDEVKIRLNDLSNIVHLIEQAKKNNFEQKLIPAYLTKHLLVLAQDFTNEMREVLENYKEGDNKNEWADPNDYIIWESFILPVLEDAQDTGFYPHEMLDKGYDFLLGNIPYLLQTHKEISSEDQSGLLRLFCMHELERTLNYAEAIDPKWFSQNTDRVLGYLKRVIEMLQAPGITK